MRAEAGFTLVEVLAALLVFSVSVLALSESVTGGLRTAGQLEHRALAGIVAQNQITLARTDPNFIMESTAVRQGISTQMGQSFDWRIEREETEVSEFFEIVVEVSQNDQALITRRTFLAPEPEIEETAPPADDPLAPPDDDAPPPDAFPEELPDD